MKILRPTFATLLFIFALLVLLSDGYAWAGKLPPVNLVNRVPAPVEAAAQRLMFDMESQGFEVLSGYFKLYTEDDCASSFEVMGTCYANNPAAPYVLPVLPYWPDEHRDAATQGGFGPTQEGYTVSHRLDPHEAILIMGVLPPPAAYFGLQSYVGNRTGEIDTQNPTYQFLQQNYSQLVPMFFNTVPKDETRVQLAASLSNAINNVVIARQSGAVWDKVRFFIITHDQNMEDAIRDNLAKSSISPHDIFTEPIPGSMRTGLGQTDDDFITLIRYAMPENEEQANAWRKELPLIVLRVRPADRSGLVQKYGEVSLETRVADSEKWLTNSVNNLATAILDKWRQPCPDGDCAGIVFNFMNWQPEPINLVGPICAGNWMNCLGDTQDTVYQVAPAMTLDSGEIYAVTGPLGTETGNATYVGLGLNSSRMKKGFANVSDSELTGTAKLFASDTVTSTDLLFVYYFARSCAGLEQYTGGACLEIPTEAFGGCPGGEGSETCDHLTFSIRDYIKPTTQRGADAALTLPPKVIKLHRPTSGVHSNKFYLPLTCK